MAFLPEYLSVPLEPTDKELVLTEVLDQWPWPINAEQRTAIRTQGRWEEHSVLWYGYVHNVAALAVWIAFVLSAKLVLQNATRTWRYGRQRVGICKGCGYDLAGLKNNRCPECGEAFETSVI